MKTDNSSAQRAKPRDDLPAPSTITDTKFRYPTRSRQTLNLSRVRTGGEHRFHTWRPQCLAFDWSCSFAWKTSARAHTFRSEGEPEVAIENHHRWIRARNITYSQPRIINKTVPIPTSTPSDCARIRWACCRASTTVIHLESPVKVANCPSIVEATFKCTHGVFV